MVGRMREHAPRLFVSMKTGPTARALYFKALQAICAHADYEWHTYCL